MKKSICIALFVLFCSTASAWGPRGHSTVASLADRHLKPSVKKQVEKYLGREIPFYSVWMDEFREDPAYAYTTHSHTFPVDADFKYSPMEGKYDALQLLNDAVAVVKDRKHQSDSAVAVNLKYIIHVVGDIHCPGHVKYTTLKTGFNVYAYKGETKKVSYHSVWDAEIIDRRCECLSPEELARNFDMLSRKEIREIQKGTAVDWANENAAESSVIYDMAHEGDTLFKTFYNPAWPIVQKQVTRAGYRLAKVLNDCFSN